MAKHKNRDSFAAPMVTRTYDPGLPPAWHPEGPPQQAQAQLPPIPPTYSAPPGYQYGPPTHPGTDPRTFANGAAIALALIGSAIQLATVSLASGDSIYWIGAALAAAGFALSFVAKQAWAMIVSGILCALCIFNVIYAENQLSDKRQQIQQDITSITGN